MIARVLAAWAARLALACFAIGIVVGVFEVGLRVAGYEALYEIYSKPSQFWQHDELLGWSHEPGSRGRYIGPRPWPVEFDATVEINALGLRGPEIPAAASTSERRVLVLGDSMVAGFEVENEDTFVARLETMLTERLGTPVRTVNAGVRGYGTDQSYLYFRERGRALGADAVVFFASGNDPSDNSTLHETRRPFGKPALVPNADGSLEIVGTPLPRYQPCEAVSLSSDYEVVRQDSAASRALCRAQMTLFDHSALFSFLTISVPWNQGMLRNLYHLGNPQDPAAAHRSAAVDFRVDLTVKILEALAREVEESGASLLVVGWPHHLERISAARLGSARVEPLEELWNAPDDEVRWQHDSHLNPEGHRRLAERIAPIVAEQLSGRPSEEQATR